MSENTEQLSPTEGSPAPSQPTPTEAPAPSEPPAAPDTFVPLTAADITMPEGVEVNESLRNSFLELANEHKIPKDVAAKLVDLQANAMKLASEKGVEMWRETQEQWAQEVTKDPEIGGDKLDATLTSVAKLLDKYGGQELRQVMDLTGAGNNIHVVKFLAKIAKDLVAEGEPTPGGQPTQPKDPAHVLYPNHP